MIGGQNCREAMPPNRQMAMERSHLSKSMPARREACSGSTNGWACAWRRSRSSTCFSSSVPPAA